MNRLDFDYPAKLLPKFDLEGWGVVEPISAEFRQGEVYEIYLNGFLKKLALLAYVKPITLNEISDGFCLIDLGKRKTEYLNIMKALHRSKVADFEKHPFVYMIFETVK